MDFPLIFVKILQISLFERVYLGFYQVNRSRTFLFASSIRPHAFSA